MCTAMHKSVKAYVAGLRELEQRAFGLLSLGFLTFPLDPHPRQRLAELPQLHVHGSELLRFPVLKRLSMAFVLLPFVSLAMVLTLNGIALVAHGLLGDHFQLHHRQTWMRAVSETAHATNPLNVYLNLTLEREHLAFQVFHLARHLLCAVLQTKAKEAVVRRGCSRSAQDRTEGVVPVFFLLKLPRQVFVFPTLFVDVFVDPLRLDMHRLL